MNVVRLGIENRESRPKFKGSWLKFFVNRMISWLFKTLLNFAYVPVSQGFWLIWQCGLASAFVKLFSLH